MVLDRSDSRIGLHRSVGSESFAAILLEVARNVAGQECGSSGIWVIDFGRNRVEVHLVGGGVGYRYFCGFDSVC